MGTKCTMHPQFTYLPPHHTAVFKCDRDEISAILTGVCVFWWVLALLPVWLQCGHPVCVWRCLHCAATAASPLSLSLHTHTLPSSQDFQLAQSYLHTHTHKCLLNTGLKEGEGEGRRERGWSKLRREGGDGAEA